MTSKTQAAGLTPVTENIWELNAPIKWPGVRMTHRMTVVRLASGDLVVHSPVAFGSELARAIRELGAPRWFVAPSRYHDLYWPQWFGAFPQAHFVAVPGMNKDLPELPFTAVLGGQSNFWDGELLPLELRGMPKINEVALLHPSSRTLIVADLLLNIDTDAQNLAGKLFLRLDGVYRKAGISRIFRAFIKDKGAFRESLREILAREFDRTIIGHGPNVGGRGILERAAKDANLF